MIGRCRSFSINASRVAPAPSGRIELCHENNRLALHELRTGSPRSGPPIRIAQKRQKNRHSRERFPLPPADLRRLLSDYPRSYESVVRAPGWRLPAGLEAMVEEHRPARRPCQVRKTTQFLHYQSFFASYVHPAAWCPHRAQQPLSLLRKCRIMSAAFGLPGPIVLKPQRPND